MHLSRSGCEEGWSKELMGSANDSCVVFQTCIHHQCRTRSEYSGWFAMYSCTEGQITSTLKLFSRAHRSAFSANKDARPRPRNLLGTSVWVNPSTFPVILYSREATCPSRSISKRPVVTFCCVCGLLPTIPHATI